jgi:gliding motility-associated-like protein
MPSTLIKLRCQIFEGEPVSAKYLPRFLEAYSNKQLFLKYVLLVSGFIFCVLKSASLQGQTYPFARLTGAPMDTTGWFLAGDANIADTEGDSNNLADEMVLVPPSNFRSGACFFKKAVNITSCQKWTAEFDFRMFEGTGADGIAFFFLNNPPQSYIAGGGMGIPPRPLGLLVCFDTWQNCSASSSGPVPKVQIRYGDGVRNYSECPNPPQPTATGVNNLRKSTYLHAKITYDLGNIQVFLDDSLIVSGQYLIQFAGYFGLTASTGGSTDRHSIKDFVLYTQRPILQAPNAGPDRILCKGDTTQLGVPPGSGNYSYLWYPSAGLSDSTVSNPQLFLQNQNNTPRVIKYFLTKDTVGSPEPRCAFADEVQITLLPELFQGESSRVLCSKNLTTIGAPPLTGASYTWSPGTFLDNPQLSNPGFFSASSDTADQIFTYTVTSTHPAGCLETDTVRVRRLGKFSDAGPDQRVCQSDTIFAGARVKPGYSYSWFLLNLASPLVQSNILDPQSGQTRIVLGISDTLPRTLRYRQIVLRQDFNCLNDDTVVVQLFPQPKKSAQDSVSLCPYDSISIGTFPKSYLSYAWNQSLGLSDPGSGRPWLRGQNFSQAKDTLYTRTVFWAGFPGCQNLDSVAIRFKKLPLVDAGSDKVVCPGDTVVLGAVSGFPSGYTHIWSPGNFLLDTAAFQVSFWASGISDSSFQYVLENKLEGCSSKDTVRVLVSKSPAFQAVSPVRICSGIPRPLDVLPLPDYRYTWLDTLGLLNPNQANPQILLTYPNTGIGFLQYRILVFDSTTGCQRLDSIRIAKQASPEPFAGKDTTICKGDSLLLGRPISIFENSYVWTGNGLGLLSDPFSSYPWLRTEGSLFSPLSLVLTQTNMLGCRAKDTVTVQVRVLPVPPVVSGQGRVCASDSLFEYTHAAIPGSGYSWVVTGGTQVSGPENPVSIRWGTGPASVRLLETDSLGCVGQGPALEVEILPAPDTVLAGPGFVCPEAYSPEYRLQEGNRVHWAQITNGIFLADPETSDPLRPSFTPGAGTYSMRIVPKSSAGCLGDTFSVRIFEDILKPSLQFVSVPETGILEIGSAVSNRPGFVETWLGTDPQSSVAWSGESRFSWPFEGTAQPVSVRLKQQDLCNLDRYSEFQTIVSGRAEASVMPSQIAAISRWTAYRGNSGPNAYSLQMKIPDGDWVVVGSGRDTSLEFSVLPMPTPHIFRVRTDWEQSGKFFTSYSDQFSFEIERPEIRIPNFLSPNEDGKNDVWRIDHLYWYPGTRVRIFNRWGELVFESDNYRNDWKPESKGVQDTYFFELNTGKGVQKGWIQVMGKR